MKDLNTLKSSLVQYIMQTEDRQSLMELSEKVDEIQRFNRVRNIVSQISKSKELACSDTMAEYIGQWHEEIYNIILKHIT